MMILLSPSKTLDMDTTLSVDTPTQPALLAQSKQLIETAQTLSQADIAALMKISEKLATLNHDRFANFTTPFTASNAKPCIHAFRGDVYDKLDSSSFSKDDIDYAQDHLRILSGLYGLLRPKDLMQAYRLEMGIRLANARGKNLYEFWGDRITQMLNDSLKEHNHHHVINLASNEYFKAIKTKQLTVPVITPVFKEKKGNDYKVIGLMAKRARGSMSAYILKNRLTSPRDIKAFNWEDYQFNDGMSDDSTFTFTRNKA